MNCFQFFIFAVLFTVTQGTQPKTTQLWIAFSSLYLRCYSQLISLQSNCIMSCELLSVLYICGVIHSLYLLGLISLWVVNCFQFFIFAVLFTVNSQKCYFAQVLWIAFSSLYLRCYSQFLIYFFTFVVSCELLSVLYICGVIHSNLFAIPLFVKVVNCFQFFIFAVLFTVKICWKKNWKELWIAFSSLYLRCYSQSFI